MTMTNDYSGWPRMTTRFQGPLYRVPWLRDVPHLVPILWEQLAPE